MSYSFCALNQETENPDQLLTKDYVSLSNTSTYSVLEALGYPTGKGVAGTYDTQDFLQRLEENQDPTNVMKLEDRHYSWLHDIAMRALEKGVNIYVC